MKAMERFIEEAENEDAGLGNFTNEDSDDEEQAMALLYEGLGVNDNKNKVVDELDESLAKSLEEEYKKQIKKK